MNRKNKARRAKRRLYNKVHKQMLILFSFLLLLMPFGSTFSEPFGYVSAETGKEVTEIANAEKLNDMRHDLAGNYKLIADIDLVDYPDWKPIGAEDNPFNGVFNWNGYEIKGIASATKEDYTGLFGAVSEDVSLIDEKIVVVENEEDSVGDTGAEESQDDADEVTEASEEDENSIDEVEAEGDEKEKVSPFLMKSMGALGTEPRVIYVKEGSTGDGTSWADAFGTLQEALDVEADSKQIWIAEGTYVPTTNQRRESDERTRHFKMQNDTVIYGGFKGTETELSQREWEKNETILSGDLDRNDNPSDENSYSENAYNVFYHPDTLALNNTAILDGVTIYGGHGNNYPDGGGMSNTNSSPTIRNVTFKENSARYGGGMANRESSNPILENVVFSNNAAVESGGAIYNDSSSPVLTDVVLSNNQTTGSGGGIFNTGTGTLKLTDVKLENNIAQRFGGGMYNGADEVELVNVEIIGNKALEENGGGLYLGSRSVAGNNDVLTNVTFRENIAKKNGGGILNDKGTLTLTEGIFEKNEAIGGTTSTGIGGGMYNTGTEVILKDAIFESNTSGRSGGGIANNNTIFELINGSFIDNTTSMNGGGLYSSSSSRTDLKDVTVTGNKTTYTSSGFRSGGGGIASIGALETTSLTLDNVEVTNNTSGWQSGGIMSDMLHMNNSTVKDNSAEYEGGLSLSGGTIKYSTIDGNKAINGKAGGVSISGETLLENVTISNNTSTSIPGGSFTMSEGGGVYISNNAKAHLLNVKIQGNSANQGGGGFSNVNTTGNATLTNVLISDNTATFGGGWKANKRDKFNNVTITNNHATHRSGGIESSFSLYINNSIIWGNSSAQAAHDEICIPSNAQGSSVEEIKVNALSSLIDRFGKVETTMEYTCDEDRSVQHNGTTINPLFQADYRLSADSPAINAGNNDLVPAGVETDLQGISRIIGGTVDIGAYEYQYASADKEIDEIITKVNDQTVNLGTTLAGLGLPNNVEVKLDDQSTVALNVEWNEGSPLYDENVAGTYEFTGTLILQDGINNPDNLKVNASIIVAPPLTADGEAVQVNAGHTVEIGGTNASIQLPDDLPEGTTLQVKSVTPNASGLTKAGEVLDFIFNFSSGFGFDDIEGEFILTLGIDNDTNSSKVAIYHYNETTEKWERVGGDVVDGKITVTVQEFSQYGVFLADEPVDPPKPPRPGGGIGEPTSPSEPPKSDPESPRDIPVEFGKEYELNESDMVIIQTEDTNATIKMPDKLPPNTKFIVKDARERSETSGSGNLKIAGDVFDISIFTPDNDKVEGPFILTLSYDNNHYSPDDVDIYYFYETERRWIQQNGIVNEEAGTITIEVDHISLYGVFEKIKSITFIDLTDPSESHYKAIMYLVEKGIVSGYGDGTFKQWNNGYRGQMAKMIVNALGLEDLSQSEMKTVLSIYDDVDVESDYAKYIAAVTKAGIFKGAQLKQSDKRVFGEYDFITREQMASVLVRAYTLNEIASDDVDVRVNNVSESHVDSVQILANLGITNKLDDFRPSEKISRGALSSLLFRTMMLSSE